MERTGQSDAQIFRFAKPGWPHFIYVLLGLWVITRLGNGAWNAYHDGAIWTMIPYYLVMVIAIASVLLKLYRTALLLAAAGKITLDSKKMVITELAQQDEVLWNDIKEAAVPAGFAEFGLPMIVLTRRNGRRNGIHIHGLLEQRKAFVREVIARAKLETSSRLVFLVTYRKIAAPPNDG